MRVWVKNIENAAVNVYGEGAGFNVYGIEASRTYGVTGERELLTPMANARVLSVVLFGLIAGPVFADPIAPPAAAPMVAPGAPLTVTSSLRLVTIWSRRDQQRWVHRR